ncbi:hypothetical protein Y048_6358 [Burkholderia pseudomallei MSHR456]|nr:hypothetical protein Y048_6358 [Burkholderia pseudomallei MSHR456]
MASASCDDWGAPKFGWIWLIVHKSSLDMHFFAGRLWQPSPKPLCRSPRTGRTAVFSWHLPAGAMRSPDGRAAIPPIRQACGGLPPPFDGPALGARALGPSARRRVCDRARCAPFRSLEATSGASGGGRRAIARPAGTMRCAPRRARRPPLFPFGYRTAGTLACRSCLASAAPIASWMAHGVSSR